MIFTMLHNPHFLVVKSPFQANIKCRRFFIQLAITTAQIFPYYTWVAIITPIITSSTKQRTNTQIFFYKKEKLSILFYYTVYDDYRHDDTQQKQTQNEYDDFFLQERKIMSGHQYGLSSTHVKISHLVTSLPTSRQQVVFALLVTNCQQVWNNLLTTCNNFVEIIRLCCKVVLTSPLHA